MDDVLEVETAPQEVSGASITLHQRIRRAGQLLIEGAGSGRLRLRRAGAPDPKGAASRHAGRGGSWRQLSAAPNAASEVDASPPSHVKALYMSWSKHSGRQGARGYHHGNLKEALIRAALELHCAEGACRRHFCRRRRDGPG